LHIFYKSTDFERLERRQLIAVVILTLPVAETVTGDTYLLTHHY